MILTCPNCASRYLLSAQVLAPEGRTVKCSSCGETWFQLPDPDELIENIEREIEEIPEAVKPIPEGSSLPALADEADEGEDNRTASLAGYTGALLIFLLILTGLLAFKTTLVNRWPAAAGFYQLIGMDVKAPGEGLVFDHIKAEMTPTGRVIIEGDIINLTNEDRKLPVIEVSVRDQGGHEIKQLSIQPPFEEIKAESTLPFKTSYKGGEELSGLDHVQLRFLLKAAAPEEEHTESMPDTGSHETAQTQEGAHHEEGREQEAHAPAPEPAHEPEPAPEEEHHDVHHDAVHH